MSEFRVRPHRVPGSTALSLSLPLVALDVVQVPGLVLTGFQYLVAGLPDQQLLGFVFETCLSLNLQKVKTLE